MRRARAIEESKRDPLTNFYDPTSGDLVREVNGIPWRVGRQDRADLEAAIKSEQGKGFWGQFFYNRNPFSDSSEQIEERIQATAKAFRNSITFNKDIETRSPVDLARERSNNWKAYQWSQVEEFAKAGETGVDVATSVVPVFQGGKWTFQAVKQGFRRTVGNGVRSNLDNVGRAGFDDVVPVQGAKGRSPWTSDLSHVTGKTAQSRNRAIDAVIREDLPDLNLTFDPQYSPFARQGVARRGVGTQIGKAPFGSRAALRDTIVHEELHHRWWRRGKEGWHHSPSEFVPDERFYEVLRRYQRLRDSR